MVNVHNEQGKEKLNGGNWRK